MCEEEKRLDWAKKIWKNISLEWRTFKMKSKVHHAAVGLNMFDLWNHFEMCFLVAHAIA